MFGPEAPYEITGDVGRVVSRRLIHDAENDQLHLYYGAADSVIGSGRRGSARSLTGLLRTARCPNERARPTPCTTAGPAGLVSDSAGSTRSARFIDRTVYARLKAEAHGIETLGGGGPSPAGATRHGSRKPHETARAGAADLVLGWPLARGNAAIDRIAIMASMGTL